MLVKKYVLLFLPSYHLPSKNNILLVSYNFKIQKLPMYLFFVYLQQYAVLNKPHFPLSTSSYPSTISWIRYVI